MGRGRITTATLSRPGQARPGVTLVFLANGAGIGAWAASIPGVKDGLGLSATALGFALLGMPAGAIVAMPIAGWLRARGLSHLLTGAGLLTAAMLALPGLAASLLSLAGALVLYGMFNGAMDVCMNARATEVEHDAGRAIMSSFHAAFSLGGLLGAGLVAVVRGAGLGIEAGLLAAAMLIAVLTLACATLDRAPPAPAAPPRGGFAWPGWTLIVLGLLCLLAFSSEGAVVDWSGLFMEQVAQVGGAFATAGYAAFSGAMIASRLGGDWVVRRLGPVRVLRDGGLLAAAGLGLAVAVPVAAPAGFALLGLGTGNMAPILFTASGKAGGSASTGVATVATLGYAGLMMGPPLLGMVADWVGLRWTLLLVAAAVAAVAACARRVE